MLCGIIVSIKSCRKGLNVRAQTTALFSGPGRRAPLWTRGETAAYDAVAAQPPDPDAGTHTAVSALQAQQSQCAAHPGRTRVSRGGAADSVARRKCRLCRPA